jgi:hypothetical protein
LLIVMLIVLLMLVNTANAINCSVEKLSTYLIREAKVPISKKLKKLKKS